MESLVHNDWTGKSEILENVFHLTLILCKRNQLRRFASHSIVKKTA